MKGKYLITTNDWFYAPDGKKYKAVWGEVQILDDEVLGVKTNRMSTNWYALVGKKNQMIVAGCQIFYSIKCDKKPNNKNITETHYGSGKSIKVERESEIFIAQ